MMKLLNFVLIVVTIFIKNGVSIIIAKSVEQKVNSKNVADDYHQSLSSLNQLEYVPVPSIMHMQAATDYYLSNIAKNVTKKVLIFLLNVYILN